MYFDTNVLYYTNLWHINKLWYKIYIIFYFILHNIFYSIKKNIFKKLLLLIIVIHILFPLLNINKRIFKEDKIKILLVSQYW